MTLLLTWIFGVSVSFILYSYVFYPLLLLVLSKLYSRPSPRGVSAWPKVSIVIAAYNEEKVIAKRIENCLALDYPPGHLQIVIASDGSDDGTAAIVSRYADQGVTFLNYQQRRGKVNVLNETVPRVQHAIVVFSDANTVFEKDAVKQLARHFQNPRIGCVCGRLKFVNAQGSRTADLEGVYWRYETFLKTVEGSRGALLGANGAIFAIRKELFFHCPPDTIVEDFVLPMKILEKRYQVIYEPQALALEEAAKHIIQEKQRRVRIGAGDFQALFMLLGMLDPRRGFPALAFWSHKVIRWFVPFFLILAFAANLPLVDTHPVYRVTMILQCLFYLSACVGQVLSWVGRQSRIFSLCYYFVSMNLALLLGFFNFLGRAQKVTWARTER